jgi:hypothetical protein
MPRTTPAAKPQRRFLKSRERRRPESTISKSDSKLNEQDGQMTTHDIVVFLTESLDDDEDGEEEGK